MSAPEPPRLGSWILLFGSLALGAGHGVFLFFALRETGLLTDPAELGGATTALAVLWFVACIPLALLSVALRRALMRTALLGLASKGAALVTAASFALYVARIVRG